MEAQASPDNPYAAESRIRRGWRLTGAAWRLMRRDGTMLKLALLGIACGAMATVLVLYFGGYLSSGQRSQGQFFLLAALALFPTVLVSVFFNVALACAASAAFDGERLSAEEALRMAWGKRRRILAWSLLSTGIGILISEIAERLPGGGRVVGWLLGAAWGLATIFVVPILALEGAGSMDAVRRSAQLIKSRWGEGVTGSVAIGAWTILGAVPACMLIGAGASVAKTDPNTGFLLLSAGIVAMVLVTGFAAATRQVFAVALYRHAIDAPAGGFSTWDLENPFTGKPKRRKSKVLKIGGAILAGLIVLIVAAAILAPPRERAVPAGYFQLDFAPKHAKSIRPEMPVVYRGHQIGEVVGSTMSVDRFVVDFYVDPRFSPVVLGNSNITVKRAAGRPYLWVGKRQGLRRTERGRAGN